MWTNNPLYIAFITQLLFTSWYMPRAILKRTKTILEKYPANRYPKLYPVSKDVYQLKMNSFKRLNILNLLIGLFIVLYGALYQSEEVLNIDSSAVLIGFFMLQYLPFLVMEFSGFKYLKLMRMANKSSTRKADLTPRYFLQGIPLIYKLIMIFSHIVFVVVIEYFVRNPFEDFGGYENLMVLVAIDGFMFSLYAWTIYGKKKNPHLSSEDRDRHHQKVAKTLSLTIGLLVVFATLQLILSATETRHFFDLVFCLYFLILAIISFDTYRIDNVNFEVYRAD